MRLSNFVGGFRPLACEAEYDHRELTTEHDFVRTDCLGLGLSSRNATAYLAPYQG